MRINVIGTPAPQGSKRHVGNGVMVESSKKVKPWRQDVKYAALDALRDGPTRKTIGAVETSDPFTGPIRIEVAFYLLRPKGHYRTGRNAHQLRDGAPFRPASRPDLDKMLRSTLDALDEAGVFADDAQVTTISAMKLYADDRVPGADIDVGPDHRPGHVTDGSYARGVAAS